jgi:hypothetical protein
MDAYTTTVGELDDQVAGLIVSTLTRDGSEFQMEILNRKVTGSKTPVAIVREGGSLVLAWVATHEWDGYQTIEGYTAESHRNRGLSRAGLSLLVAAGLADKERKTAVFSDFCLSLVYRTGFKDVNQFSRRGDEWFEVLQEWSKT